MTYAEILQRLLDAERAGFIGFQLYLYDPLGNLLRLSTRTDDCPTTGCRMTLPHVHSAIES